MLKVKIWGARGSVPVAGPRYARHGGSTTALEIELTGARAGTPERILIDCGTGLAELGRRWNDRGPDAIVLQTHMHWDHIQGFPFFAPLFDPQASFALWAVDRDGLGLREVLAAQMTKPTFPIGLDIIPAKLGFDRLEPAGERRVGDARVSWTEVHHPSGSTAYRIDYRGASVVFSGDVEVRRGSFDDLVGLARGADLLIMDAQYLPSEYPSRAGFGHSTPEDAVSVAAEAGVSRLLLTHHDPSHDDDTLEHKLALARRAATARGGGGLVVENAREGTELALAHRIAA